MAETVDFTFLAKLFQETLTETRAMRRELAEVRQLSLLNTEYCRRLDQRIDQTNQRITELKDDFEIMIKAELGGRLAHFETRV